MSLPRLLAAGLSAASGRLRFRFLSTAAASHPPWAMVARVAMAYKSEPPTFYLAEPPHYSYLMMPTDLIRTSDEPVPDSNIEQLLGGMVSSSSGADGLLLVTCCDGRVASTIVAEQGRKKVRHRTIVDGHVPNFTGLGSGDMSRCNMRPPIRHQNHIQRSTTLQAHMDVGKVTGSSLLPPDNTGGFIPCVLGSRRIPPSKGNDILKNQAYADVQVHSGRNDDEH